jgi:hypothetical protein
MFVYLEYVLDATQTKKNDRDGLRCVLSTIQSFRCIAKCKEWAFYVRKHFLLVFEVISTEVRSLTERFNMLIKRKKPENNHKVKSFMVSFIFLGSLCQDLVS